LCLKRLSSGRLRHWPSEQALSFDLNASELIALLNNGDPSGVKPSKPWRDVKKT